MLFVFVFSIHIFFLAVYALMIDAQISRMDYVHLLFALALPIVGEICLLLAETGRFNVEETYSSPLLSGASSEEITAVSEPVIAGGDDISREELLEAVRGKADNLPAVLKQALKASDEEVVHIAASNVMRLQRSYENRINQAAKQYQTMPDDMNMLMDYVEDIEAYLATGLPEGQTKMQLLKREEELLLTYLHVFPLDEEKRQMLQNDRNRQADMQGMR